MVRATEFELDLDTHNSITISRLETDYRSQKCSHVVANSISTMSGLRFEGSESWIQE